MKLAFRKTSLTFLASAEIGIACGVILAFFTVPGDMPAHTFWTVAAILTIVINCLLLITPKKS